MRKILCILILFCLLASLAVTGAAEQETVDDRMSFLVPKYLYAQEENQPIYDAELAEFLRKASCDAYSIYETEVSANLEAAGFKDIDWSYHEDESVFYEVLNSDDELVRMTIPLETHFVTGSKQVRIGDKIHKIAVISFRGTVFDELLPVLTDAMVFDAVGFHAGFICAAQAAYNYLSTSVYYKDLGMSFLQMVEAADDPESGCHILVTGHSLGGAVANLFTSAYLNSAMENRLNTLCYTFASPLVCADWCEMLLDGSNIINIVNSLDVVPHIGYQIKNGTRPGHEVSAEVWEDFGEVGESHKITVGYKKLLKIVDEDVGSYYRHLYRSTKDIAAIHTDSGDDYDRIYIPPETLERFAGQRLLVHGEYALQDNTTYPFSELAVQGGWLLGNVKNAVLSCDLVIESGDFTLGTGTVTVKGDLRVQGRDANGTFTGGTGHLLMNEDGHLLVEGDVWFQGGDTNFLYRPDMTAGTLELKGDFYARASTGGQCELIFCPEGSHKVLFSGEEQQTIWFEPYVSNESYAVAAFCHLETTNPVPFLAPNPISMQYIEDDLTFEGDLGLSSYGDMIVTGTHTVKADNIILEEAAHPEVTGQLTLDGNVAGGRLDVTDEEGVGGRVIITGDLVGTDLYYGKGCAVEVRGDYMNNNADICLCDGLLQIRGDFRLQVSTEDGAYAPANAPFVSIYEDSRIEVDGDFYLQMESGEQLHLSSGCTFVLRGDFYQICDDADPDFRMNYGLSNLVLAGESVQTVDAPIFYFTDITLANTGGEGVVFLHELYGISGIFNAFGRADGTATPFRFPRDGAPRRLDYDRDGIPDCLDPEPEAAAVYENLPAAISEGVQEGTVVRFLYAPVQAQQPQNTVVWLALYEDGCLVELREQRLNMQTDQIHELEIELADRMHVDAIRIFQLSTGGYSPLWFAASWQGN